MSDSAASDPEFDAWHMARAIELAAGGEGLVEPNPMVGCTIVLGGETVGEGLHRRFGGAHAEIEALESAGSRAAGATVYVSLEPCCHQGKTPPCTAALIRAGVARVVVAQRDPFSEVAGRGVAELRQAGIAVDVGLLADEARRAERAVPETRRDRAALDHRQVGHDARRQPGIARGRQPLDFL